jgi:hypothetical protein
MLPTPFGEIRLLWAAVLLALGAIWLFAVLIGLRASRVQRRWPARIGISVSLVIFLAGWLSVSPLSRFLADAIYGLLYPANRHYFAKETGYAACAVILAASNVVGIAGIWASLGRPHWFLRVLPIVAIPPLLLLVRAYEPCFVFLVQSVVTVVPLVIARNVRGWGPFGSPNTWPARRVGYGTFQFGILDLMGLTLVIATVLGVAVSAPEEIVVHEPRRCFSIIWPTPPSHVLMGTLGTVLGLVVLLGAWVTLSRGASWLRLMGFSLAWPSLLCMLWLGLWREATGRHFRAPWASAATHFNRDFASPLRCALARVALVLLSLLILVPLGGVYYHLAFPPRIPDVALPEPNGYDDLLAASMTLEKRLRDQGTSLPALWKEPSEQVIAFRASNRSIWNAALQEVHAAIQRPSQVPLHYRAIEYGRHESMDDLASALRIEGKAAASEGRFPDAIRCFTDIIRLGRAAGRGGLVIDWLADSSIQRIGIEQFHHLARTLDAAQCRIAIRALAAEDKEREPFEDVWARERVWGARSLGWSGRLYMLIGRDRQRRRHLWGTTPKYAPAELRIAMAELAVQAYARDHGALPNQLSQLVPEYLPAVPVDPLTDRPPVYELNEQGYVLYSPEIEIGWAAPPQSDQ